MRSINRSTKNNAIYNNKKMFPDNAIYIVLVVLTIIGLYIGYSFWRSSSRLLTFADVSTATTIKGALLTNPTSVNFAYGGWFYVSNLPVTTNLKNLFRRDTSSTLPTINAFLEKSSAAFSVQVCVGSPDLLSAADKDMNKMTVTKSFPLQKWVNIVVSIDGGKTCDIYLDGKMISTFILGTSVTSQPGIESGIVCGPFPGYVANFKTWGYSLDPQSVWNYYLAGSGRGESLGLNDYGLQMEITKNGTTSSTLKVI